MRKQPEGAAEAARGNAGVSYACRVAVFSLLLTVVVLDLDLV